MRYLLERMHDHGLNRFLPRNKRHLTATMYMHNHVDRKEPYPVCTETCICSCSMKDAGSRKTRIYRKIRIQDESRRSPFLGNDEFGRGFGYVHRITVCVLHDFLLNVDSDLGRDLVRRFSDGYSSVSYPPQQGEVELTNGRNEVGQLIISIIHE